MCWLTDLFKGKKKKETPLELSPSDWIPKEAIGVAAGGSVVVDTSKLLPKLSSPPKVWVPPVPEYDDPSTGSMLPNFSHEHNNILVAGASEADHAKIISHLQVGDIAVYRIMEHPEDDPGNFRKAHIIYAIHRIVEISDDNEGKMVYTFRGDNNPINDPYPVYSKNILWVSIGSIF